MADGNTTALEAEDTALIDAIREINHLNAHIIDNAVLNELHDAAAPSETRAKLQAASDEIQRLCGHASTVAARSMEAALVGPGGRDTLHNARCALSFVAQSMDEESNASSELSYGRYLLLQTIADAMAKAEEQLAAERTTVDEAS